MAYHSHLIEGPCMLWIKPACPFHSDLISIVLEEPVDPGFTWFLLHQIVNQGLQFCMRQQVPHVAAMPHHMQHPMTSAFCRLLSSCWCL